MSKFKKYREEWFNMDRVDSIGLEPRDYPDGHLCHVVVFMAGKALYVDRNVTFPRGHEIIESLLKE